MERGKRELRSYDDEDLILECECPSGHTGLRLRLESFGLSGIPCYTIVRQRAMRL